MFMCLRFLFSCKFYNLFKYDNDDGDDEDELFTKLYVTKKIYK